MSEITIRHALPSDVEALVDLETRAMHFPMGHRVREWFRDDFPGEVRDHFMVAEHEGRLVSAAALIPLTVSYRSVLLETAFWDAVVTDEGYRRQGLCRRLFEALTPAKGPDVLFVWGLTWLYRRFGYFPAIRNHGGLDSVKRVVRVSGVPHSLLGTRPATVDDTPFIAELRRRAAARSVVSVSLDEARLRFDLHPERTVAGPGETGLNRWQEWRVLTGNGEPVGYFVHDPWDLSCLMELEIDETKATWREAGAAAIRATAEFPATSCTPGEVPVTLPDSHPELGVHPYLQLTPSRPYGDNAAKIPDAAAFLRKVAPALERLLSASPMAGWTGEITLSRISDATRFRFEDGRLAESAPFALDRADEARVRLMPGRFEALVFGYRSIAAILAEDADCAMDPEAEALLDAIFPPGDSFLRSI